MALESATSPDGLIDDARARLMRAIESYDEAAVPGRARQRSGRLRVEISQEHFANNLIRGRLLSLARLWGRGSGPLALLACPPGEQHDISLLAFGLILRSHGWRILFLGANTPLSTTYATARMTAPAAIVLVTFGTALVKTEGASLRRLARITPDKRVICRHATAARPPRLRHRSWPGASRRPGVRPLRKGRLSPPAVVRASSNARSASVEAPQVDHLRHRPHRSIAVILAPRVDSPFFGAPGVAPCSWRGGIPTASGSS